MSFVILEFKTKYKGDKSTDWVLIAPRGESFERSRTWYPVHTLKPKDGIDGQLAEIMHARWNIIEPAYEAWKKGEEVPENGTPLGAWGGVNQDQSKYLKDMGVVTVEQVADLSDSDIAALPFPGRRELPKMAKAYLEGKDKADLARQNEELLERIAAMEEMLTEKKPARKKSEAA